MRSFRFRNCIVVW